MILARQIIQNVFSDKASLIIRALLREPGRDWVMSDFEAEGATPMLASMVLRQLEKRGIVARVRAGRNSSTRLSNGKKLLAEWRAAYAFSQNRQAGYVYTGTDFLPQARAVLERLKVPYALTLYSASRRIAPYLNDAREFLYLDPASGPDALDELEARLNLRRATGGENVVFALPFYKTAVFRHLQVLEGYPAVSNLQLYLDLLGHAPLGWQEADHLTDRLKARGEESWQTFL